METAHQLGIRGENCSKNFNSLIPWASLFLCLGVNIKTTEGLSYYTDVISELANNILWSLFNIYYRFTIFQVSTTLRPAPVIPSAALWWVRDKINPYIHAYYSIYIQYTGSPSGSTPIDALLQTSRQLSVLSSSSSSNSTATGQATPASATAAASATTPLVPSQLPRAKSALPARSRVRRIEILRPLPLASPS